MEAFWVTAGVLAATVGAAALGAQIIRRLVRDVRADHMKRPAMWNRFYAMDWGEITANNYGFAPAQGDDPQRFQKQMYLELLKRFLSRCDVRPGMTLLEVSCGRGGGLKAFLEESPVSLQAIGLDVAVSAIAFCRRTYGDSEFLRFVQGSALDLPFPENSFDVALNVEASNDYGDRAKFFVEVARVLKPGGILLFADSVRIGHAEALERDLQAAGFDASLEDITCNVAEASRLDTPRRLELIRRQAPLAGRLLFRRELENYAAVEGSKKYRSFEDGRRTYLMSVAVKA